MYKFFLILISFSAYTHAWWDTGHALVCDEAYKRLSPEIQKKVDELIEENWEKALQDDFPDRKSLLDNVYKYD